MPTTPPLSVWQKKAAYEEFSRQAMRSPYLAELVRRHKTYRHLLRFAGHVALFALLVWAMMASASVNVMAAILCYPAYLFVQGLLIAGFMIHAHELSHQHIKSRWLNDLVGVLSGLVSFVNFYSFQYAHRLHHRNIGNLDTPEAGAPVSATGQARIRHDDRLNKVMIAIFVRSKALWFLTSWPLFIYYGDYSSWLLPYRDRHHRLHRRSVTTFVVFVLVNCLLLALAPGAYLGLYLLPVLIGGQRILAITFMHHAHEDSVFFSAQHHNFYNTVMATTDRDFGMIVNFFMLNNGYHIPHHLNPHIAYYDLKKASQHLRKLMPETITYHYYPHSRFYRDFFAGIYEQRLSQDHEYYQVEFLTKADLNVLLQQKRLQP